MFGAGGGGKRVSAPRRLKTQKVLVGLPGGAGVQSFFGLRQVIPYRWKQPFRGHVIEEYRRRFSRPLQARLELLLCRYHVLRLKIGTSQKEAAQPGIDGLLRFLESIDRFYRWLAQLRSFRQLRVAFQESPCYLVFGPDR
jgi:hypothetical protein